MRRWAWASMLALVACEGPRSPEPSPAPAQEAATAAPDRSQAPIPGPGVLDGVWVVGGASNPRVWVIARDRLTTVDVDGTRRRYRWRAAAPCQLELTSEETRLRTWVSYGLVDGALFAGLGAISAVGDDHTVCTDVGVYRVSTDGCTLSVREPVGGATELPARCGLDLDGHAFHADDTDTPRAAGGPMSAYRHRGVLMSTSLATTSGERMPDEATALARARKLAKGASGGQSDSPFRQTFAGWSLPASGAEFHVQQAVWAAAVNQEDRWTVGLYFYEGEDGAALALRSIWPSLAPPPFVRASEPRPIHPARAPVMIAEREGVTYGRFARTNWDHLVVDVLTGIGGATPQARERSVGFDQVRAIEPGGWDLGAPAAYRTSDEWRPAQVVGVHGERVFLIERGRLIVRPKAEVRQIELDTIHPVGTEVLVAPEEMLVFQSPVFVPARIVEVLAEGLAYVVVADVAGELTVRFDQVMLREAGQPPVQAHPADDDWASVPSSSAPSSPAASSAGASPASGSAGGSGPGGD